MGVKYKACASKCLNHWIALAKDTGIAVRQGVRQSESRVAVILQHRIKEREIEAFNGVIKRIIYKACGYNDLDYLYLKIGQEALK